ncbi:MAG: hypothetical protein KIT09_00425 [Bryobacteraceae bacterium]|nr:hypothetical protein [Bryobacteraceae bacterium]
MQNCIADALTGIEESLESMGQYSYLAFSGKDVVDSLGRRLEALRCAVEEDPSVRYILEIGGYDYVAAMHKNMKDPAPKKSAAIEGRGAEVAMSLGKELKTA